MISVGCPNCGMLYQIPEAALGESGRNMRCASCGEKWFCTSEHIQIRHERPIPPKPAVEEEVEAFEAEGDPWNQETPGGPDSDQAVAVAKAAASGLKQESGSTALASAGRFGISKFRKSEVSDTLGDVESEAEPLLAAERKKRQINNFKQYLTPQWAATAASILLLLLFIAMPSTLVSYNPSYAALYKLIGIDVNLEGLAFDNITTKIDSEKGTVILMLEGDITNITAEAKSVPRLKFFVKNASGADVYSWVISPPKSTLLSGESMRFKARYADPSPDTASIQVRFFNSKDLSAKPRS